MAQLIFQHFAFCEESNILPKSTMVFIKHEHILHVHFEIIAGKTPLRDIHSPSYHRLMGVG